MVTVAAGHVGLMEGSGDLGDVGRALESAILGLLERRGAGKTICPSDAARAVSADGWRDLMEPARQAAQRLVAAGDVVVTQGGEVVSLDAVTGPIRIRRAH